MKKVALQDATFDQLKAHATQVMGLDIHPAIKKEDKILAKMLAADETLTEVMVADEPEKVKTVKPAATKKAPAAVDPMDDLVWIMVQPDPIDGDNDLSVSVNGSMILIPRSKKVPVKMKYLHVLRNCIKTEYVFDQRSGKTTSKDIPAHAVSEYGRCADLPENFGGEEGSEFLAVALRSKR
tara:strand:- start:1201 stop:1743 length:543 start_codon:yes stop_codon:yes gene_type:complete